MKRNLFLLVAVVLFGCLFLGSGKKASALSYVHPRGLSSVGAACAAKAGIAKPLFDGIPVPEKPPNGGPGGCNTCLCVYGALCLAIPFLCPCLR